MSNFLESHQMDSLIETPTCYKSPLGTCIDLILTNGKSKIFGCDTVETGMSDHHLMIFGYFKSTFSKLLPKNIFYRHYKKFSSDIFNNHLATTFCAENYLDYDNFENVFIEILNLHAPLKTKLIRGNDRPHVDYTLRKEIMKRSRLKHVANKTKCAFDIAAYRKQRNLVSQLNIEQKKRYFGNTDNTSKKSIWDLCEPYLGKSKSKIVYQILQDGKVISDEFKVANLFNNYFCNIYNLLNIQYWEPESMQYNNIEDPVNKCIAKFDTHPSILKIKNIYILLIISI